MLEIKNLSFAFGTTSVINDLSLSISKGSITALLGISGSGKTTLFNLIAGILNPKSGTIAIDGCTTSQRKDHLAYLMQDDLLLPWRTVLENVTLPCELGKHVQSQSNTQLKSRAIQCLKEVGLIGCEESYPEQLSGGMRQRVALARALMLNRPFLLLDEPFSSLDFATKEQLYTLLKDIKSKHGTTILLVTHDIHEAIALSDTIVLLQQGSVSNSWSTTQSSESFDRIKRQLLNAR